MNYYFLTIRLPTLMIGAPPDISFDEFIQLLEDNLNQKDLEKTKVIRRYYDLENIRALWKDEKLDRYGNLNELQLEEALAIEKGLPDYAWKFLQKYEELKERLTYFPELLHAYFREEAAQSSGFLKKYLKFEREWRLVFVAFRAKELGRNLMAEMQFEDPEDPFVLQILMQKDSTVFEPPIGYEELKTIFEEYRQQPLLLHETLYKYRFQKIEEMLGFSFFTIDNILGYMVQLILAEKWIALDKKKGSEIVDKILKEAS